MSKLTPEEIKQLMESHLELLIIARDWAYPDGKPHTAPIDDIYFGAIELHKKMMKKLNGFHPEWRWP